MNLDYFLACFVFIIGLCWGSFANVLIYRLKHVPKKERKIFISRSFCPHCRHKLSSLDLIPFFSWVFLRGRCRYCRKKISPRYPSVEIAMGLLFLFTFFWSGLSIHDLLQGNFSDLPKFLLGLFVSFVAVVTTAYDILYMEIPDEVLLPSIVGLFLLAAARSIAAKLEFGTQFFDPVYMPFLSDALIGLAIPLSFFILQILLSGGAWIGGGDLRIAMFMGLLLGWQKTLVALSVGYCVGSLVGLLLIFIFKKLYQKEAKDSLKMRIPFGPFLSFGTLLAYFYGDWLVYFYVKFLLDY